MKMGQPLEKDVMNDIVNITEQRRLLKKTLIFGRSRVILERAVLVQR